MKEIGSACLKFEDGKFVRLPNSTTAVLGRALVEEDHEALKRALRAMRKLPELLTRGQRRRAARTGARGRRGSRAVPRRHVLAPAPLSHDFHVFKRATYPIVIGILSPYTDRPIPTCFMAHVWAEQALGEEQIAQLRGLLASEVAEAAEAELRRIHYGTSRKEARR